MPRPWSYLVVAGLAFTAGSAAGLTLARPDRVDPCPAAAAAESTNTRQPTAAGNQRAGAHTQLGLAATALSRVPALRPEPVHHEHSGEHQRNRIRREDLPPAVEAVLRQVSEGRKVAEVELERRQRNGQTVYDAELDIDGVEHEYTIDEQGKVIEAERDLALSELPAAVTTGITTALPGAILMEAEQKQKDGTSLYEVELRLDGHRHELLLSADGRITRHQTR